MRLVQFRLKDDSMVEVNPDNVSWIYSTGSGTGIVFGGRSAQSLIVPYSRAVTRTMLVGKKSIEEPQDNV